MTVAATNAATAPTATTDKTAIGRTQLTQSFDTFLALLTTQLKNQDPLSPTDSTQFTQQLVQMTGVEQQLATNDLLKQLVANSNAGVASAVGLIGKKVTGDSSQASLSGGLAKWNYTLPSDASDVKLEVLDSNGKVLKTAAATGDDLKAGDHSFSWNGSTDVGNKLADGTYTLRITAKDKNGQAMTTAAHIEGIVSGVEQVNGQTVVTVNGLKVPLSQLTAITQPPATSGSDSNASGGGSNTAGGSTTNNTGDQTSSQAA